MAVYEVIGDLRYRDHDPGERFEATLDPDAEMRAVLRGNIRVIDSSPTRLQPGSYLLPDGWRTNKDTATGAPEGASSTKGAR